MSAITQTNRVRLQARLRSVLHSPAIMLNAAESRGSTVQFRIGADLLGTVHEVTEEGERFWAVTLIVREEDLETEQAP